MNPVILLDEVDKLGADWRGDPSSALLEVLDPAQNSTSATTTSTSRSISPRCSSSPRRTSPSRSRRPARPPRGHPHRRLHRGREGRHRVALPRAARRAPQRAQADEVVIEEEALRRIVTEYTREAGVRNVERLIQKVLRKSAKKLAEGAETPITVVAGDLRELLGRPRAGRRHGDGASRSPASRPGWRSPARAATCSSSRPPRWPARASRSPGSLATS